MQLPLFVYTQPVALLDSSLVMLAAGNWTVRVNHKDSVLNLSVLSKNSGNLLENIQDGQVIEVTERSPARATIVQKGTEQHISLYLDDSRPD